MVLVKGICAVVFTLGMPTGIWLMFGDLKHFKDLINRYPKVKFKMKTVQISYKIYFLNGGSENIYAIQR